ncbi:hypothetical protein KSF_028830 [Reticulibacter mediterranei]|uniref:Uncharacterized protein n=1 Tax=Reticulibacter mediterranei TaxID=2778369 RepID=A0A8J3ILC6_9CHLR|nr:hypothetical protein KSF_028830 [Reticulibacter mediterranei]
MGYLIGHIAPNTGETAPNTGETAPTARDWRYYAMIERNINNSSSKGNSFYGRN